MEGTPARSSLLAGTAVLCMHRYAPSNPMTPIDSLVVRYVKRPLARMAVANPGLIEAQFICL